MSSSHLLQMTRKKIGYRCRQFFGGVLVAVAMGLLLGTVPSLASEGSVPKATLWIGAATADITPKPPVALTGFQTVRITRNDSKPLDRQRPGLGVPPGRPGNRPSDFDFV